MHPLDTTANLAPSQPGHHTPEQQDDSVVVREALKVAYDELDKRVPEGRYKALAMTAFETAAMWAVKGIFHRK